MSKDNTFKLRAYADLSNSQIWTKHLKPDLENMINEIGLSEGVMETFDKSAMRDIERAVTIKTINRIIRKIERAEDKLK